MRIRNETEYYSSLGLVVYQCTQMKGLRKAVEMWLEKRGERFGNVTERFLEMPGMETTHIKVELFQRPVVGLGHILPGGCDVRLSPE